MDKNNIKLKLHSLLAEAEKQPIGKSATEKVQKAEKDVNNTYYKEVTKKMGDYDSASKSDGDSTKKGDLKKHDSEEKDVNFNGMDQIQYDNEPSEQFKQRAIDSLKGSAKMGNKTYTGEENGNTEEVWGASGGKHTGEEIVKSAVANSKKDARPQEDAVGYVPKGKVKTKLAVEGNTNKKVMTESDIAKYVEKHGIDKAARALINKEMKELGVEPRGMNVNNTFYVNGADNISFMLGDGNYRKAEMEAGGVASQITHNVSLDENKENNNEIIKETKMKRLRFEKPFNGLGKALTLIPESYKVDNKMFEMTDGNENYKIRWEGSLTEGEAIVVSASDKKLMNEDIQQMKHLMGFKSESTLGTPSAKERVSENSTFRDIMNLTNTILEGTEKGDKKPINESAFAGMGFTNETNLESVTEEEVTESEEVTEGEDTKIGGTADGIVRGDGHDQHVMEDATEVTEGEEVNETEEVTESKGETPAAGGEASKIGTTADGVVRGAGHDKHVMEDAAEVTEGEEVNETEEVTEGEEVTESEEVSETEEVTEGDDELMEGFESPTVFRMSENEVGVEEGKMGKFLGYDKKGLFVDNLEKMKSAGYNVHPKGHASDEDMYAQAEQDGFKGKLRKFPKLKAYAYTPSDKVRVGSATGQGVVGGTAG